LCIGEILNVQFGIHLIINWIIYVFLFTDSSIFEYNFVKSVFIFV